MKWMDLNRIFVLYYSSANLFYSEPVRQPQSHQSQALTSNSAIFSRPSCNITSEKGAVRRLNGSDSTLSSSAKPSSTRQSKSSTPSTRRLSSSDRKIRGHTTSLRVSPSQAMWPGYFSTSETTMVRLCRKVSAQTPRALPGAVLMYWHAGFPLKGPRRSRSLGAWLPFPFCARAVVGCGNNFESK